MGNLIENALEALGPEPGGEISVTLHYRHGWLHCEVNDDGPGIAPDKIDHIFDKGVSTKGSERGVGLALVKQQVENLGGSIAVESEPGIFTQFFVQIPRRGEVEQMINVLIIDDDAMVAELNRRYVAQIGLSMLWNSLDAGESQRDYLQ